MGGGISKRLGIGRFCLNAFSGQLVKDASEEVVHFGGDISEVSLTGARFGDEYEIEVRREILFLMTQDIAESAFKFISDDGVSDAFRDGDTETGV